MSLFSTGKPLLYHISGRDGAPQCPWPCLADLAQRRTIAFFQIRKPGMTWEEAATLGRVAREFCAPGTMAVLLNGDAETAQKAGLAGVHWPAGRRDLAFPRSLLSAGFLVGRSVHSLEEAGQAEADGADYLLLAPVFAPRSKPVSRPPLGLLAVQRIAAAVRTPLLALGGIGADNAAAVMACGVAGLAGISFFHDPAELGRVEAILGLRENPDAQSP